MSFFPPDNKISPMLYHICKIAFSLCVAYLFAHLASSTPFRIKDQGMLVTHSLIHCD